MKPLEKVAQFIVDLKIEQVPKKVVDEAKLAILDSLGAALGAAQYEEVPTIIRQMSEVTGEMKNGGAQIWGHPRRVDIFHASFLNAIMGHALELDDVHTRSKTHIGAVVVPATWSLAEALGAIGRDLLEAVIVGYEVMARIGEGFGVASHRSKGWHVTGTAGTFGAAAGCAKLLHLDSKQTLSALGMAGTQSSGLWSFLGDGASCKKLHPARAAQNGLVAAMMAKSGMTGPTNILDAEDGGLYPATSDKYEISVVTRELGHMFELLYLDRKPYPCCRSTHCAIAASLQLLEDDLFQVDQIDSILVETYDIGVKQCGSAKYPKTAVEAKFSTPFTVAVALLDGEVFLNQFTSERINDTRVKHFAQKVTVTESAEFTIKYPGQWGCRITCNLAYGSTVTKEISDAPGSVKTPLSKLQLEEKFTELVRPIMGEKGCTLLLESILKLDQLPKLPLIAPLEGHG